MRGVSSPLRSAYEINNIHLSREAGSICVSYRAIAISARIRHRQFVRPLNSAESHVIFAVARVVRRCTRPKVKPLATALSLSLSLTLRERARRRQIPERKKERDDSVLLLAPFAPGVCARARARALA